MGLCPAAVSGGGALDDLTVLFASLLETAGIETGFIIVPGHFYPAFDSKIPSASFSELHPDRSLGIPVDGLLWVPIEITLVGKQGFVEAWRRGAELWRLYDQDSGKRRFTRTAQAQALFGPVALKESDLGLQYGGKEGLAQAYRDEIARLAEFSIADLTAAAKASGDKRDLNLLGLANVRFGRLKDAEAAFSKAVRLDPGMASAQVNLGNIAFLQRTTKGPSPSTRPQDKGQQGRFFRRGKPRLDQPCGGIQAWPAPASLEFARDRVLGAFAQRGRGRRRGQEGGHCRHPQARGEPQPGLRRLAS